MASKYLSAVGDTMREMVNNRIRPCSFYNSVMSEWIYLPSSIKVCQFLQYMEKMKMSHTKLNLIPILYLFLETESPFYVKLYICWDQNEDLTSFDIYSICKPIQRQLSQKHSFSVLYKKKKLHKVMKFNTADRSVIGPLGHFSWWWRYCVIKILEKNISWQWFVR